MFVCLFYPSGVDAFHVGEVDQGSKDGLYGFAADFGCAGGILLVLGELLVHLVIERFMDGVADRFFE